MSRRELARAFAPASVANLASGFDLLGHTLGCGLGDEASVRRISEPTVRIAGIEGTGEILPFESHRNTAGAALLALRRQLGLDFGFELTLRKGVPVSSGLGGSASSCVAALLAANSLLDSPLSREALYPLAQLGEAAASGVPHGDNVGACLWGGVVLTTADRVVPLRPRCELWCAVVRPHCKLETRAARAVLEAPYPLDDIVRQQQHLALLLTGLERGEPELIAAGLHDILVEPRRAALVPGFPQVQRAALAGGALGASFSGAGPSVFAWFTDELSARRGARAMTEAFAKHSGLASDRHLAPVAGPRAEVLE